MSLSENVKTSDDISHGFSKVGNENNRVQKFAKDETGFHYVVIYNKD